MFLLLFRLFLLLGVIYIIWRVINRSKSTTTPIESTHQQHEMVQCAQCKVHIPKDSAVSEKDLFFCGTLHLQDWNRDHS